MPSNLTSLFYFEVSIFTPLPREETEIKEDNGFAKIMEITDRVRIQTHSALLNICWSKGNKANF